MIIINTPKYIEQHLLYNYMAHVRLGYYSENLQTQNKRTNLLRINFTNIHCGSTISYD